MSDDHIQEFSAPSLEELNQLIPGYDFLCFLAKGGMGAVYLCRQTSLDRFVAIKVLPPELCQNEGFKESFETEAKLMAKLNHVNLIGVFDFGNVGDMLYIVMEYVKGKSLFDFSSGKMIEQEVAVSIISGVCMGLEHAHDAGMLHRDIKPANILLNSDVVPKIGDFGLARPSEMIETGIIMGTPHYAAPEVLGAPEKVDKRTDIYAVGVMLYELLAGRLPDVDYVSVTDYANVDARFDTIIKRAIHHDVESRYATVNDLSTAINEVINKPASGNKLLVGGVVETNSARVNVTSATSAPLHRPSLSQSGAMPLRRSTELKSGSSGMPVLLGVLLGFIILAVGAYYLLGTEAKEGALPSEVLAHEGVVAKDVVAKDVVAENIVAENIVAENIVVEDVKKGSSGSLSFTMEVLADMKAKATIAVINQQKEIEKEHVINLNKLRLNLRALGEKFSEQKEIAKSKNIKKALNALNSTARVNSKFEGLVRSKDAKSFVKEARKVQVVIRAADAKSMLKIRDAYEQQLIKHRDAMSKLGKKKMVSLIDKEIKGIGKTNKDFEGRFK